MVYSTQEYSELFTFGGVRVSARTIKRRCINKQLPRNHIPHLINGVWIIEVPDISPALLEQYDLKISLKEQR